MKNSRFATQLTLLALLGCVPAVSRAQAGQEWNAEQRQWAAQQRQAAAQQQAQVTPATTSPEQPAVDGNQAVAAQGSGISQGTPDQQAADQSSPSQAGSMTDQQIENNIESAIANSSNLSGQAIGVRTEGGVVTLSGTVKDDAARQEAERLASSVSGVQSVSNELRLHGGGDSAHVAENSPLPEPTASSSTAPGAAQQKPPQAQYPQGQYSENGQSAYPQNQTGGVQGNSGAAGEYGQTQDQPHNWGPAGPPPDIQGQQGTGYDQPEYGPQSPAQAYPPRPYPGLPYPGSTPSGSPYPGNGHPQGARVYNGYLPPRLRAATGPVTLPAGTALYVRVQDRLDARHTQPGTSFRAVTANNIFVNGLVAIPRGTELEGTVIDAKQPGDFKGSSKLALQLSNMRLDNVAYPLDTNPWTAEGPGKGARTAGSAVGGATLGAVIGAIAGGGVGAAVGAGVGGAAGAGISGAAPAPNVLVPPEAVLAFTLRDPITVQPVHQAELDRMVQQQAPISVPPPPYLTYGYRYPHPPPPPPYYYGRYWGPYYRY